MREMSRDFSLCCYNLTVPFGDMPIRLADVNATKPKYSI